MSDVVIVGAGSAGCVLAARLTEDPSISVTLLEAGGPDNRREVAIPAAFGTMFRTEVDWAYETEPEPECEDRRLFWPRGKMLGGSSSINAMLYIRGAAADYDGWAKAGCTGWSYDEVLPLFLASEDNGRGAGECHGVGGPLAVNDQRTPSALARDYVAAGEAAGLVRNDDFNGPSQDGVGLYQVTQRGGRRESAATAFLRPALRRPNLTVVTGAMVDTVVVRNGRAVAVEAVVDGQRRRYDASSEVVLSAGAIGTPAVLQRSGIGDPEHLQALGIDVVADAPQVGERLADHVAAGLLFRISAPLSYYRADRRPSVLAQWFLSHRGPLSSPIAEAGGFTRVEAGVEAPDVQLLFAPALFLEHGQVTVDEHGFSIGSYLLTPRSAGSVRITSTDPAVAPAIRASYFSDRQDLERLTDALELCLDIAHQQPLARHGAELLDLDGNDLRDREARLRHVRHRAETMYHPTSTAAMGPGDLDVCDPELRVRGVDGLRVVDASVFPTVPRGNTNAPTIMVAERAAALLRRG